MSVLDTLIGDNFGAAVSKIISLFKVDPTVALEKQTEIAKIQLELQGKLQDAISSEIAQSAAVIKAEAGSQSWLPRNVRPLLLLIWGVAISFNIYAPVIGQLFGLALQPLPLDPWVYKLTAIGFTGYVGFRSIEKLFDKDN